MAKAVIDAARWTEDRDGLWLCLKTNLARRICEGMEQSKTYDVEIRRHREKRSKSANDFAWALLDQLAEALHTDKNEIYKQKVREVGPFKDFILSEDEAKTFRVAWENLGIGWPTEQVDYDRDGDRLVIRAYYGSSQYNTKQMSRLIDSIVQDCKDMGIDVLSEQERSLLLEEWKPSDRFDR